MRLEAAMRLIASWGLDGPPAEPFGPSDAREWSDTLAAIRFERINGLAVEAAAAGALDLTDEQVDALLALHRDGMTWCLKAEQKLLRLADAFEAEGIGYAVLKGPALAHTVYEEPCLRPFGDLDLLVRSRDYDRAAALLGRLGHVRRRPEPRPGWEARFGKASVHIDPDDGIEVDLHRTLVLGPFGQWIDGGELMDHRATFPLGGREVSRLDDTGMLLNVALHAALGWADPRLMPLRDTAELDARGDVDLDRLAAWTERWHLVAPLTQASNLLEVRLGRRAGRSLRLLPDLASRGDRRRLSAYGGRREKAALPLGTIRAIPGLPAKVEYALGLALPSEDFLRHRGHASALSRLRTPAKWMRQPSTGGGAR